ncbi:hypothetical protein NKG05_16010 [Oerskovia sp. M15]
MSGPTAWRVLSVPVPDSLDAPEAWAVHGTVLVGESIDREIYGHTDLALDAATALISMTAQQEYKQNVRLVAVAARDDLDGGQDVPGRDGRRRARDGRPAPEGQLARRDRLRRGRPGVPRPGRGHRALGRGHPYRPGGRAHGDPVGLVALPERRPAPERSSRRPGAGECPPTTRGPASRSGAGSRSSRSCGTRRSRCPPAPRSWTRCVRPPGRLRATTTACTSGRPKCPTHGSMTSRSSRPG